MRREFISGFTGSTGTAIVTENKALMWTDGRYYLQAEKELDANWTLMKDGLPETPTQEDWLSKELPVGAKVGVDPYLISLDAWRRISKKLQGSGRTLVRVDRNLVDLVWADHGRPATPCSNLITLGQEFSGKSWKAKVSEIRGRLKEKDAYGVIVAALDEVAWLFNLRGSDIDFNPVFFSYAIVTTDDVSLFIDDARLNNGIKEHLCIDKKEESVLKIFPYENIDKEVKELAGKGKRIWISSKNSAALASLVPEENLITETSPVCVAKAVKNEVEIEGMRQAHIRDAAALCRYFAWLENEIHKGYLTEVTAADKLEQFRKEQEHFVGLSFPTISGSGPNGAVIHYRPEAATARTLSPDEMYLCDSGAQYFDGTTDVTRTVHFGTPSQYEKECFTRVLKGNIQMASAKFPKGTRGHVLDILARKPLWDCGLNYLHGTGHGVGAFLNVHEGPQGISPRVSEDEPLKPGMFVTDEPGYYEDGKFGIRIENVMLVKEVKLEHNFKSVGFYGFEHITLVPIQTKMLVPELLTSDEINWINEYHSLCVEKVGAKLREQNHGNAVKWLLKECQTLG
ncbi:xaa-Pro aminopeptidase 1-like isoform X2 [Rhopilema esculentum]